MIALKTQLMKRAAALCLAVVLTLSVNAAALFGGKEKAQPAEGSPTAFPITPSFWPRAARERT